MPTTQLVSYDVHILKMVIRDKDEHKLRHDLVFLPARKYGESLLHKVCKSGQDKLLQVFLDCGRISKLATVQAAPMHDACYGSNSFKTFELLLKADPHLIRMMDGRPLYHQSTFAKRHADLEYLLASILVTYWNRVMLIKQPGSSAVALVRGKQSACKPIR
jgi:hypothetical protein